MTAQHTLPRILWLYWHQGWANTPWIVQKCADSWTTKNPNWVIRKLDAVTLSEFCNLEPPISGAQGLPLCALADIIRVNLLADHGGVWSDATVFCQTPLDQWVHQAARTGFFAFERPAPDRPLASWFIASVPGNHLIEAWRRRVTDLWVRDRFLETSRDHWSSWSDTMQPNLYFWFHRLFQELLEEDPRAAELWAAVDKISAKGPHFVQFSPMLAALNDKVKAFIDQQSAPVHKLTYRYNENNVAADSALLYLLQS